MKRLLFVLIIMLAFPIVSEASEWKYRYNVENGGYPDVVRGDDPIFSNVTISNSLSVGNINYLNYIDFNTEWSVEHAEARMHWNDDSGTVELGLSGGEVLNIGQKSVKKVVNKTSSILRRGKCVYKTGSQGNRPTVAYADCENADSWYILGLLGEDIAINGTGFVYPYGIVKGTTGEPINTLSMTVGQKLYLSKSGDLTTSHPLTATAGVIIVGTVEKVHATEGWIDITNPEEFSIGNNFNGTMRQLIRNKSTGTSAATGFTAVNDQAHYATFGIAGSNNTVFPNEVSVMYGPGYGDHWQAVDGNEDFVWFTDPTDSHNNSSLNNEVMRLYANGDLSVANNLTANQSIFITDTSSNGEFSYTNDRMYLTNIEIARAIDRTSDVALTSSSVINTDTETLVFTGDIQGNSIRVGNIIKLVVGGSISNASAADVVTIRIKLGGVTVMSIDSPGSALSDDCWHGSGFATTRIIGASGEIAYHFDLDVGGTSEDACGIFYGDTTAANDITVTAEWNNAKAGNIFYLTQGFVEYKN